MESCSHWRHFEESIKDLTGLVKKNNRKTVRVGDEIGATVVTNVQMWGRWNNNNNDNEPHVDLNDELVGGGGRPSLTKHRRDDATDGGID